MPPSPPFPPTPLLQGFRTPEEVKRFQNMMDEMCHIVAVKHGGSLKAEHGTGRNVAPYVEMEWGESWETWNPTIPCGRLGMMDRDCPDTQLCQGPYACAQVAFLSSPASALQAPRRTS